MTEISGMSCPSVSVCYVQTDTQGRSYQDGGSDPTASHYKEEFVLFTSQIQFPASLLDTPMKFNTGECNNTDAIKSTLGMIAFSVLVGLKKKLLLLLSLLLLKLELGW